MNTLFIGLTAFLFVLAVFDLIVGVSNDAVNFLNSAVGAKVATFKTIILVASAGIFLGAATSNGMMEIARNGIVHPSYFSYREMVVIFVAVMVSDVLLLDIFNSLGMPTSTTVSMVFELIGGAFAISLLKTHADPSLSTGVLMNSGKAISMIGAIFISVAIAFAAGVLVQWISRLIFSFTYKEGLKWKIGLFGGLCATAIIYFMIIKGLGKSTLMSADIKAWLNENQLMFLGITFAAMTVVMQLLHMLKTNVFKVLVLMGTFALAMAFAGNDLVNFIGVPLAGYSAFVDYNASRSMDPDGYLMTSLDSPAKVPVFFLLAAGAIMVVSLATSKKAQNVIRTSVDLSRQDSGDEMFGSSKVARVLVRRTSILAGKISTLVPSSVKAFVAKRFDSSNAELENGAAFDSIRATVNLVLASLLIALGTSLKLPLSTTYVTFMVAMGTSLADKAWGRESAVFRITGVMAVIGGWFITAGAAFILCFCIAMLMYFTGNLGTICLAALALFVLISNNLKKKSKSKEEEKSDAIFKEMMASKDEERTLALLSEHVRESQLHFLDFTSYVYRQVTEGFMLDDLKMMSKAENSMREMRAWLKGSRRKEMMGLRRVRTAAALEKNTWFHLSANSCEEMLYSLRRINDACKEHTDNNFVPLDPERIEEFKPLRDILENVISHVRGLVESGNFAEVLDVIELCRAADMAFSLCRHQEMERIQLSKENITTAYVYLNMIQESQQMIISLRHLLRAADHFISGADSVLTSGTEMDLIRSASEGLRQQGI